MATRINIPISAKDKNNYDIPQDTKEWLEDNGVHWWKPHPMVCYVPLKDSDGTVFDVMSYSAEHLKNTPLEEIKRGFEELNIAKKRALWAEQ